MTGANAAYRTIELPVNVEVKDNTTSTITIEIDLKKQFGSNPVYDIELNPQIHSLSQNAFVKQLIDNLSTAFKVI